MPLMFTSQSLLLLPASMPHLSSAILSSWWQAHACMGCVPDIQNGCMTCPLLSQAGSAREYYDTPSELLARSAAVGLAGPAQLSLRQCTEPMY